MQFSFDFHSLGGWEIIQHTPRNPRGYPLLNVFRLLLSALIAGTMATIACAQAPAIPPVHIVSPATNQTFLGPDVPVMVQVQGIVLSPGGNNLHFMLDNDPFHVQFDSGHPHVFKNVKPGTHTIRVYIANGMHEALRGTMSMITIHVAYPNGENCPNPSAPMLTYNLPQGEYVGIDAGDISLDYLLSNVCLTPQGNKITYYVDGRRFFVTDMNPRHLTGLTPGFHTIRIELQDQFGDLIEGPFNSVERTILVSPDRTTPTPGKQDEYPQLPKIQSIKGAMTMGMAWKVEDAPKPMTRQQIAESTKLTVKTSTSEKTANDEPVVEEETGTITETETKTTIKTRAADGKSPALATDAETEQSTESKQPQTTWLDESGAEAAPSKTPAPASTPKPAEQTTKVEQRVKTTEETTMTTRESVSTRPLSEIRPKISVTTETSPILLRNVLDATTKTVKLEQTSGGLHIRSVPVDSSTSGSKESTATRSASKESTGSATAGEDSRSPRRSQQRDRGRENIVPDEKGPSDDRPAKVVN
jgi:hypothetical protein